MLALKYVRLTPANSLHAAEGDRFVFCVAPCTHRQLAELHAATHTAISAGYCQVKGTDPKAIEAYGESESLHLKPAPGDAALLTAHARATYATGPVPF